jgi:acyl-CoA synthetase (AMP-forming)/AMP-acid ligase II
VWPLVEGFPAVRHVMVIAVPDDHWGERPLACVVPVPGRAVDGAGLRTFLAGRVASWWVPEHSWVIDEIPKTSTGKFAKAVLRARTASGLAPG